MLTIWRSNNFNDKLWFQMTYFKNKNTAASILYYERGLLIDPNNQRILNNLTFAENQRLDKIDPLPLPLGQRIINQLFDVIPINYGG